MKIESEFNADQSALFQTRGALFAVDQGTESVVFSSSNAGACLGRGDTAELFGEHVRKVFGRDVTHALRNAGTIPSLGYRRQYVGRFPMDGTACDMTAFRTGTTLILEAIPITAEADPSASDVLKDVEVLTDVLLMPGNTKDMLWRFVSLLRTMSGYHCVALDGRDGSETVTLAVAGREALSGALCEAPRQLHVLYDVNDEGNALTIPAKVDLPDLGLSALHVPVSDRLNSLRRAGVGARAAIGVRNSGRTCGILKFLHATPRLPNRRTQFALAHLSPLIGLRLSDSL